MKKFLFMVLAAIMLLSFTACGPSTISNEKAGEAVKAALEARWAYQESSTETTTVDNAGEVYAAATNAELEPVVDLKEAEFEDEAMGTAVKEYISILEKQIDLYSKYDGDYWTQEYNNMIYRRERQNAIKTIVDKSGVEFTGTSKENFDSIMDPNEFKNLSEDAEIVDEAFTIVDKSCEPEYDWYNIKLKVTNNTGYTFPEFAVIYRVKTEDGTTASSQEYTYIENFEAGSTAWTQDFGYDAKPGRTYEAYGYIAGLQDGYIDYECKLKEPVIIEVK